jgi:hypothetical protein
MDRIRQPARSFAGAPSPAQGAEATTCQPQLELAGSFWIPPGESLEKDLSAFLVSPVIIFNGLFSVNPPLA